MSGCRGGWRPRGGWHLLVASFKFHGPWSIDDVLAPVRGPDRPLRAAGGVARDVPAPGLRHQRASFRLHVALDAAVQAAGASVEVLEAINVILPSGLVVPDIVVADAGAIAEDSVSIDAEAVQLVVELVSPHNETMDRKLKTLLYCAAGRGVCVDRAGANQP
ncbi:Uma2 family endonuclease [Streptomyces noursei]|uniref:Uma2 family endonuclease n=1 Tax=Streptomyces noursei TaxID=1971 RepID=UPI001F2EE8C7|nr:Uma2 family endonuclease [Streptomyces noursei]